MDKRIDYDMIERSFGCDNCDHSANGSGACEGCLPGRTPSGYRPMHGTIQAKVWYNQLDRITYAEFLRFLNER